jgi:arylsulfatase A-like enzyme
MRLPGVLKGGRRCQALTAPVDFYPTLCSLCGIPIPRTVEGYDLSAAWRGERRGARGAFEQEALLTMNFSSRYDWIGNGQEWRGVRTRRYNYAAWLDGRRELYDLERDPLEMHNLIDSPAHGGVRAELEETMRELQARRGDVLGPCEGYREWYDSQRRVVRNAYGPLSHPESEPDWSLVV